MRDIASEKVIEQVAAEFAKLRKEQGLSHEALAEKAGVTRPAISFIESNKRAPTLLTSVKIAKALGVSLSDILKKYE